MSETLKEKTASGLFWGGLNSFVQQLVGILFGIVLGRLLNQSDFGMIAMLSIFSLVANDLQNSGFKVALANLRDPGPEDYSSVFWFNILMGVLLYVILFFSAPLIAGFYHEPGLTSLARYVFLGFLFSSFGTAQSAYLFKNLRAKQQAKAGMIAVLVSSSVAVVMALLGFGYWSLATQTNLYIFICICLYWYWSGWRPSLHIDLVPAFRMFRFSVKLLISQVLTDVNNNVLNILLGRFYGGHATGSYNQAFLWSTKGSNVIQNMLQQVAQPVLVSVEEEGERQLRVLRKMMRFASFLSFPLLFGLSLVSHEFIVTSLGEKWSESASYLRLLAVGGAFLPLSSLLSNAVVSKGCSNVFMYITLVFACLQTLTMVVIYGWSVECGVWSEESRLYVMVLAFVLLTVLCFFVWTFFVGRLLGYRLGMVLRDVLPFALSSGMVMFVVGCLTGWLGCLWLLLVVRVILAGVLYYVVMRLGRVRMLDECVGFLKRLRG